jgi:RNA polymerase sigma-70 factor (ECF subfamily)
MDERNNADERYLAQRFQTDRPRLTQLAYRMLGSLAEAEDAVQDAWLRLSRSDSDEVGNLSGWLTTVVARICLDALRKRKSRREEPAGPDTPDPAERIAFVLHDMFDLPFDEIAPVLGRSTVATRQLASRARRRVRSAPRAADVRADRTVVEAFLTAAREGNFEALLSVLDPQVVLRADDAAVRLGGPRQLSGSAAVAKAFLGRAQAGRFILADGAPAILVAPGGRLLLAMRVTIHEGRIAAIETIAEPARLTRLAFSLPD